MYDLAGKILTGTGKMDDPNFAGCTVLVAEHNEKGALGFIINQPFPRALNELVEFSSSPAFPLYKGGPVDEEHLYFVHQCADQIPGSEHITKNLFLGGDFATVIQLLPTGQLATGDIKIFVGYCGWNENDLETEIADGYWEVETFKPDLVFS
ncbi:YqgE/AlgH family protein [Niabella insulamsoli]|uniref:YqgE/AlgH family protein n=1 Tax=Niabella insulamsoli TaxID=3144874 RepID=UPI0031FD9F7D